MCVGTTTSLSRIIHVETQSGGTIEKWFDFDDSNFEKQASECAKAGTRYHRGEMACIFGWCFRLYMLSDTLRLASKPFGCRLALADNWKYKAFSNIYSECIKSESHSPIWRNTVREESKNREISIPIIVQINNSYLFQLRIKPKSQTSIASGLDSEKRRHGKNKNVVRLKIRAE